MADITKTTAAPPICQCGWTGESGYHCAFCHASFPDIPAFAAHQHDPSREGADQ